MNKPTSFQDSPDFIKYGTHKGKQIYLHKPSGVRYTDNGATPGRRIPPERVGAALSMFYGGLSLREVKRTFGHVYDSSPSTATIYEWIEDYTNLAKREMSTLTPNTGDTWVADEVVLKIGGHKYWNWNVMDADSRYLLAARVSPTRGTRDAEAVMRQALKASGGKPPKYIITDKLASYNDGIEQVFGSDTEHVQSGGIRAKVNNNLSERLQGTIRQREKVMRGLKSQETGQMIMDGWMLHYNYFKPHESLKGKTPAEKAGIDAPLKDWEMVARLDVRPFSHQRSQMEARTPRTRPFRTRRGGL